VLSKSKHHLCLHICDSRRAVSPASIFINALFHATYRYSRGKGGT
jgi:hypothetical protein